MSDEKNTKRKVMHFIILQIALLSKNISSCHKVY
jgi:hypothetical protein